MYLHLAQLEMKARWKRRGDTPAKAYRRARYAERVAAKQCVVCEKPVGKFKMCDDCRKDRLEKYL